MTVGSPVLKQETSARAHQTESEVQRLSTTFVEQLKRARGAEERAYLQARAAELAISRANKAEQQLAREVEINTAIAARLKEREHLLEAVFASHSWRLTAPLRILSRIARGMRRAVPPPAVGVGTRRPPRATIFVECTHTYHSDLNTGIQRVVRNVLRNVPAAAQQYGYDVVPVIAEGDQLRFADVARALANKQDTPPQSVAPQEPSFLSGGLDDFDRCDGSILLLLDSSWATPLWSSAKRFKERGGVVIGVIYDLIPITHSHTCVPELIVAFKAWVAEHFQWTDGFVCISRTTADSLTDYMQATSDGSLSSLSRISFFHLGSELDFINPNDPVRQSVKNIFAPDRHVFLMVGSLEPRKMHAYVLDAFDAVWAHGGSAALVIVGRHGWKVEEFLERVASHPQLDRQLFLLRDVTDAELNYCYYNASSLVIASEIEGFGLPVVEAFQRGLPIMCSDIPVFREIAAGKAEFFSLNDPANLSRVVETFCESVDLSDRGQRQPQRWISWRESTEQLLDSVISISQRLSA